MAQQGDEEKTSFKTQWGRVCGGSGGGYFSEIGGIDGQNKRIDGVRFSEYEKVIKDPFTGLPKITIKYVESIQFRVNGQWQAKHGAYGIHGEMDEAIGDIIQPADDAGNDVEKEGKVTIFELRENEYISSATIRSGSFIDNITFFTNFGDSISCGGTGGGSYSEPESVGSHDAMLLDVRGKAGRFVDQIQLLWGPAIKAPHVPAWGEVCGGSGGGPWGPLNTDGVNSKITGVRLWGGELLDAIQFQVEGAWKYKYGGDGDEEGVASTFILNQDEYFQKIDIRSGEFIDNLKMTTNKLRSIQAGGGGGEYGTQGGNKILIDCRGRHGWNVDQLQFLWMDDAAYTYTITSCTFDVDQGKILSEKPEAIAEMSITNDSDSEQQESFKVSESVWNSSSFIHSHGFTVKIGTSFEAGIPKIADDKISMEVSTTNTWTYGEENKTIQTYDRTFTVHCKARTRIVAQAIVTKSVMDIPYTITVENGMGDKQTSHGKWKGVSTHNIALKTKQFELLDED